MNVVDQRHIELLGACRLFSGVDRDVLERVAAKATEVLRPGGRLALFWNVFVPPAELADQFAAVYRRVLPGTPFAAGVTRPIEVVPRSPTPLAPATFQLLSWAGPFQFAPLSDQLRFNAKISNESLLRLVTFSVSVAAVT